MKKYFIQVFLMIIIIGCSPTSTIEPAVTGIATTPTNIPTFVPISTNTMILTQTPESTITPTIEPIIPINSWDIEQLYKVFSEVNSGGKFYAFGTKETPVDPRVSSFVINYLRGIFNGVAPNADVGGFQVQDYYYTIDTDGLELDLNKISELNPETLDNKLVFIQLKKSLSFPSGSVYNGPYPLEDMTYQELLDLYTEEYDHFLAPGVEGQNRWTHSNTFTVSTFDTSKIVLGLNMSDLRMVQAYFDLYMKHGQGDGKPKAIFTHNSPQGKVVIDGIEIVVVINLSGDPELLEQDFRKAYEEQLGTGSGISFEEFTLSIVGSTKFFIPTDYIKGLSENQ